MRPPIGLIVLFCIGGTEDAPELRPATVVRSWSDDCVNVQVAFDGHNDLRHGPCGDGGPGPDRDEAARGFGWRTSVTEGEGIGQWRRSKVETKPEKAKKTKVDDASEPPPPVSDPPPPESTPPA